MKLRNSGKIDQKTGRAINRRLVLNLIRKTGGISRSEISTQTGLSAAAVGFVVADLIEEGFLHQGKPEGSNAGRKPVPLTLNENGHLAIGIKLSLGRIDCILTDMSIKPIDQISTVLPRRVPTPDEVVAATTAAVQQLVSSSGAGRPILGVGLTLPGRLDVELGRCVRSHRFQWHNVDIGPLVSASIGLPVYIEDDTLAFGLAHHLFGLGQSCTTFAALAVGEGIGCATITHERVHRGALGNAGKVGHVLHSNEGPMCECGRVGCLQASYSASALEQRWRTIGAKQTLIEAVDEKKPEALALVKDAGKVIGRHLAEWITVIDPERVILGGESVGFGNDYIEAMQTELDRAYFREHSPKIWADERDFYWTAGAAAVAVQRLFDFETMPSPNEP